MYKNITDVDIQNFYLKIGSNIASLRKNRGLSQLQLSHILGHNSTTIVSLGELGKKHFSVKHLLIISSYFEVDIAELFK